jgi:hypothetical protein
MKFLEKYIAGLIPATARRSSALNNIRVESICGAAAGRINLVRMLRATPVCIFICLLLTPSGNAQVLSGNAFAGYSYLRADFPLSSANLNGWDGSVQLQLLPFLAAVADFSGQYGSPNLPVFYPCPATSTSTCLQPHSPATVNTSIMQHNFLFGARVSRRFRQVMPFAEVLLGASHINEDTHSFSASDIEFSDALGGGIDYSLTHRWALRMEVDALQTRFFSTSQANLRASTGVVVRF